MEQEITVEELNGRFMGVELKVLTRHQKDPSDIKEGTADYYLVPYVGKCLGTTKVEGKDCLVLKHTLAGVTQDTAVIMESIEDISLYVRPDPATFAVPGLEKNPKA